MSEPDMDIFKSAYFREQMQELSENNSKNVKTASLSISYHRESSYSSFIYLCYATKANRNACHLSFLSNNSYILLFHPYLTK